MKRGIFIGLAALGFALSLWLEVLHVRAYLVPSAGSFCSVGATLDCASVALSRFSVLLNVPVPLWGALGFLTIGLAAYQRSQWLVVVTGLAALASVVLLGVELFAIGALCLLCEAVHLLCFVLFGLALRHRKELTTPLASRDDALVLFGPGIGLAVALMLYVPRYWGVFSWKAELPFEHGKTPDGYPWIGAKNPTITLEEITDYGCPHCKSTSARNLRRLAEHPNTLRIVRRQYPRFVCMPATQGACLYVRAAYCAEEQGKFWQVDRFLFEHGTDRPRPTLATLAAGVGLDYAKLAACSERPDIHARAERETRQIVKQKVLDTPTLMIGGKRVTEETLNTLLAGR